ncbi:uncharacterized protein LOC131328671 [Rhododendron vialii]|uniref:uncharacterized protein LOC131328671 n=1 Tax=Rhododendron vialii TaxID=182163 RepID=UPI00265DB8AD|nr:uncharacterized protein LOC131328671 [Rhododendron vialii]
MDCGDSKVRKDTSLIIYFESRMNLVDALACVRVLFSHKTEESRAQKQTVYANNGDPKMTTTGKKRLQVEKATKAGVEGSKAAEGRTHTNPYLLFLYVFYNEYSYFVNVFTSDSKGYLKEAKAANKSPRFLIGQHTKVAAEIWKQMSDAERAPFVDKTNERKSRIKKQIPKEKKKNASPVFRSRCSPLKLVKVNEALTKAQQDAVQRVGFGSMLQLKCTMLNRDFISRLVKHFNPVTKSLEFGRVRVYTITPDDVRRALGLFCGTIPVPTDTQDPHFEHITKMFGKNNKPLKRGVTFAMMQQVFNKKKADVKFQTSYVLFVLSCFLCPTTKDVAATKFYPAVHNILQTPTYAWAEFVLDWLVNEIAKYKKRCGKVGGGKKDSLGVAGCVLLLMLIYFDKHPMGMKVGSEGEPLIQSWTTKLIKERIAKDETLELVDPIAEQFPKASYRHPCTIAAYHDLKKNFLNQMQHLDALESALMGDVPKTCTPSPSKRKPSTKRKNRNEDDVEMGDVHMDVEDFPSTSTVNPKKVRHGVDVEDMDGSRMSGLLFAREMPLYSPEAFQVDVVQNAQHVELEEETVVENEEQEVALTPPLNKRPCTRVQKSKSVTRPSTKRGTRTFKPSKATRTPYVAPPEVKLSKLTKQESQVWAYVMQPPNKTGEEDYVVKMDGGKIHLSHDMLHEVFKPRGHMSTMVMTTMTEWLMKQEKAKAPIKDGVPRPTRHMFSSSFVNNLLNFDKVQDQKVIEDPVDANMLGYDVAMCNLLFLPVLLNDIEHWYCVVVNLVDKRIEVLDSMVLQTTDKKVANATVVSTGQSCLLNVIFLFAWSFFCQASHV